MSTVGAPADKPSARGLSRYVALLRRPGVARPIAWSLLARLPIGMTSLALLLLVEQGTSSFATAGLVSGAYTGALAVAAPVRGRSVDRRGGRRVLLRTGVAHGALMLATLAGVLLRLPLPVVAGLAVAAGACFPPVGPLVRSLWGLLLDDDAHLATAYALDAVLVEISFVTGPLLVGLAVVLGSPALAVALAAALVAGGSLGLAGTAAVRRLPGNTAARGRFGAPLREPSVRRLLIAVLALGLAFGSVEVAVPAYAARHAGTSLAGPLLAVWALGSATGGLLYGARDWRRSAHRQYPLLLGLLAIGLALPLLAGAPWQLGALLLLGGATIAPFSACNSVLLGRSAPAGTVTEAFAWSGTGIIAGIAVGNALTGVLVDGAGPRAGFLAAAAAGLLALVTAVVRRRPRRPA